MGEPLGTPGGCTWNLGAATLRHKKAAVESGLVCLLMAWHAGGPVDQAFSAQRLHDVLCFHVLKNPQGAVPSARHGAFHNLSADTKQGLRKRSLHSFVFKLPLEARKCVLGLDRCVSDLDV